MTRPPLPCLLRPVPYLVLALLMHITLAGPAHAQPSVQPSPFPGTIVGHVVDQSGAPLPAASVRLTPVDSPGTPRTAACDQTGAFRFPDLPAGTYELVVSAALFSADRQIVRVETATVEVAIALSTGAFSEEVTVLGTSVGDSPDTLQRLPGALAVIDHATLASSQVFTVNEALRKVTGVHARDEEGFGLRPNIGIRGLNPTRSTKVLLLEDGVPFTMAPYGDNASYYHPPVERFDRVEILKGSGQIAYGPQTVGGIVNYLTPQVPPRPSGWARVALGSHDFVNAAGAFGTTVGPLGFLVDAMHKHGDGARDHLSSDVNDITAKAQAAISASQSLTVKINRYDEESSVTYSGLTQSEYDANPRQNPFVNDAFAADRIGATATWRAVFTPSLLMTMNVYRSSFDRDWWRQSSNSGQRPNDRLDPLCGGMANLNTTCGNEGRLRKYDVWGVEPRFRATPRMWGLQSETDFGIRFHAERQDRLQKNGATPLSRDGVLVESNLRENRAVSAFVQTRLLLGRLTLTPGLRVERVAYDRTNRLAGGAAGVAGDTSLTQWIPGLGAAWAPTAGLTVFGGIHRGFAPPRTEDVISNTTGGVIDLDPELSWDTEVGLRWLAPSGATLDATWFRMDYENQIVPASLAGGLGATLTNGGQTLHQGFEVAGRLDSAGLVRTRHNVYARLAYTAVLTAEYTGVRTSAVPGASLVLVTGHRLPYAPEHLVTLTGGYQHPSGIHAQLELVGVSDQFSDDLNSVLPSPDGQRGLIPGHVLWNATVSYLIAPLKGSVFFAVKNIGNRLYIADRSRGAIPGMPRTAQAGIRFRF